MDKLPHPCRTVLYVPASNDKAVTKVLNSENGLGADWVLFDLEDAVHPETKEQAREQLRALAQQIGGGAHTAHRPWRSAVRINALSSVWGTEDILAALAIAPDAIVLPKVETPQHIADVLSVFEASDAAEDIKIWAMIESPKALLHLEAIVTEAETQPGRLSHLLLGTNDLALETGVPLVPGRAAYHSWFMQCVLVARSFGLSVVDGVFTNLQDPSGFKAECHAAAALGFDGKSLIHPNQIIPCRAAFSPDADTIAQAQAIIAAFADPANQGQAVLTVNGQMVEELHLRAARQTISRAGSIGGNEALC